MTKHNIKTEGLPKGWEPIAIRMPVKDVDYIYIGGWIKLCDDDNMPPCLIIQKTKPREITIVETEQDNIKHDGKWCNQHFRDGLILTQQHKYWRIKE